MFLKGYMLVGGECVVICNLTLIHKRANTTCGELEIY